MRILQTPQTGASRSATQFENLQVVWVPIQHGGILIFVTSKWRIRHKDENLVSGARR
jgi:hypothetical protein